MTLVTNSPVWRPYTQHALQPGAIKIARAEGCWLEAEDGARFLDAISSWWVITHGHRRPEIVLAIKDQADLLDQIIFAGFTHEPAERLARRLVEITPKGLDYVFYSDSGSTCVECIIPPDLLAEMLADAINRNLAAPVEVLVVDPRRDDQSVATH